MAGSGCGTQDLGFGTLGGAGRAHCIFYLYTSLISF